VPHDAPRGVCSLASPGRLPSAFLRQISTGTGAARRTPFPLPGNTSNNLAAAAGALLTGRSAYVATLKPQVAK